VRPQRSAVSQCRQGGTPRERPPLHAANGQNSRAPGRRLTQARSRSIPAAPLPSHRSRTHRQPTAHAPGRQHKRGRAALGWRRRHEAGVRPAEHPVAKEGIRALVRDTLIAGCRADTAPCKNARLPMQSRFGRSPTKAPLARSEDSSPAIEMSPLHSSGPVGWGRLRSWQRTRVGSGRPVRPKRSCPRRRPDYERDRQRRPTGGA
jgi:hypothetical protein